MLTKYTDTYTNQVLKNEWSTTIKKQAIFHEIQLCMQSDACNLDNLHQDQSSTEVAYDMN